MSTTTQAGAGPVSDAVAKADGYLWAIGKGSAPSHIVDLMKGDYRDSWLSANGYPNDYTEASAWEAKYRAALAPPAVVPEEVQRLSEAATQGVFGIETTPDGDALWVGTLRPDGEKLEHIIYGVNGLNGYRASYTARARADAALFVALANRARALLTTPSGRTDTPPAGGGAVEGWTLARAFDLGFQWAAGLYVSPQSREDSRAVGRTLLSPDFDGLNISLDDWNSFQSGDAGMCEGKRRIKAALDKIAAAPEPAAGGGREIAELADRIGKSPVGGTTLWYALAACEGEDAADQALKGLAAEVAALNASRLPLSTPSEAQDAGEGLPILTATVTVYPERTNTHLHFGEGVRFKAGSDAVLRAVSALQGEHDGRCGCPASRSDKGLNQ